MHPEALFVLLVDDDTQVRHAFRRILVGHGLVVTDADSGEAALALLDSGARPDVVLLDFDMPGMKGDDVLRSIRKRHGALPVVVCSGGMTPELAESLMIAGASTCLVKSTDSSVLVEAITVAATREVRLRESSPST